MSSKQGEIIDPKQALVDALGNRLVLPTWYPGSLQQFASEVADLEPDHCSWPEGQRCSPDGRHCCTGKKTSAGVCIEHLSNLLPLVHSKGVSKEKLAYVVRSMQDPRLTEMLINAFYAEEKLERSARKCSDGGLNFTSMNMLRDTLARIKALHIQYMNEQDEVFSLRKSLELAATDSVKFKIAEEIKRITRGLVSVFKEIGEVADQGLDILKNAIQDERNWQDLATSNSESLEVKKQVAQVEAIRKDQVPRDEVLRSFQQMLGSFEKVVRAELPRAKANEIMEQVYQNTVTSTASLQE